MNLLPLAPHGWARSARFPCATILLATLQARTARTRPEREGKLAVCAHCREKSAANGLEKR